MSRRRDRVTGQTIWTWSDMTASWNVRRGAVRSPARRQKNGGEMTAATRRATGNPAIHMDASGAEALRPHLTMGLPSTMQYVQRASRPQSAAHHKVIRRVPNSAVCHLPGRSTCPADLVQVPCHMFSFTKSKYTQGVTRGVRPVPRTPCRRPCTKSRGRPTCLEISHCSDSFI